MLPKVLPSPLTSLKEPIGHPNWIYELKHDGFRGTLYVDREQAWLVSRKGKKFRQFDPLLNQVLRSLKGHAILDGEIVVLDEKGRSNFYDLMALRGEPRYYAFDLVWLNRQDLRSKPLLERKRRLRGLVPPNDSHLLYVEHLEEGDGARFFELVCEQDLEGIICKFQGQPVPVHVDQSQKSQLLAGCRTQGNV